MVAVKKKKKEEEEKEEKKKEEEKEEEKEKKEKCDYDLRSSRPTHARQCPRLRRSSQVASYPVRDV